MTSQERRDWTALRANDAELRRPVQGVMNSEDIRLAQAHETWQTTSAERVIRNGHPSDREAIRRVAIERIGQYSGSIALSHLVPIYEDYLRRVDAAILADVARHIEYLWQCIARERKLLEKASERNPYLDRLAILQSIRGYYARITEIHAQLSEATAIRELTDASAQAGGQSERGSTLTHLPLAYCPA